MSSTSKSDPTPTTKPSQPKPTLLEEDDEFEDFPVEDWTASESEPLPPNSSSTNPTSTTSSSSSSNPTHLWEESWDDDDENEDFSKQLKEELRKVQQEK